MREHHDDRQGFVLTYINPPLSQTGITLDLGKYLETNVLDAANSTSLNDFFLTNAGRLHFLSKHLVKWRRRHIITAPKLLKARVVGCLDRPRWQVGTEAKRFHGNFWPKLPKTKRATRRADAVQLSTPRLA